MRAAGGMNVVVATVIAISLRMNPALQLDFDSCIAF